MRVVHASPGDSGGGAEGVAVALHRGYLDRGHDARLFVGRRSRDLPQTYGLVNGGGLWSVHDRLRASGRAREARIVRAAAAPGTLVDTLVGREDFVYPGSREVLAAAGEADVVQLHNLHGGYFDLRLLPALAEGRPVVLSPQDAWLASGHCAHSLGCERWRTGCGHCPDLRIYPALLVDGTAGNLRRKRAIYGRASLHVGVPCGWLADVLADSVLGPSIRELRVIPNGVDIARFSPGDRGTARIALGLDPHALVILFTAHGARSNRFKDHATLRSALDVLASTPGPTVEAVVLGDAPTPPERTGRVVHRSPGLVPSETVATWLRAADVYVHAARAETQPLAVCEALASGIPVVASAVGGVPETVPADTGLLVPVGDAVGLAHAVEALLGDPVRRATLGHGARRHAVAHLDVGRQVDSYLAWFEELVSRAFEGGSGR